MIHDRVELSKVGNISLKLLSCATGTQRESVELDLLQQEKQMVKIKPTVFPSKSWNAVCKTTRVQSEILKRKDHFPKQISYLR